MEDREPSRSCKTRGSFLFLLAERHDSSVVKRSTNTGGLPYKVLDLGLCFKVKALTFLHTIFTEKGIPVLYLYLKKGAPFTFTTEPYYE